MTIGSNHKRLGEDRESFSESRLDLTSKSHARRPDGGESDSAKELWAALLLQNIATRVVQWETKAAPAETRPGDGKLTFGAASIDAHAGYDSSANATAATSAESPDQIGQVQLEMDGGRLGTVHLTVHRQGTVVSVVVGVADPIQRALVELELGSLTQALRAAGLNVGSVRVLHPDAAGTAFAQGKKGMTFQSTESASLAYRGNRQRQRTDAEDGLDVVG